MFNIISKPLAIALMSIFGVGLLGTGTVYAAQDSLPGEILYPAKVLGEQAKLVFTLDSVEKADLEMEYLEERVDELNTLTESDDYGNVKGLNIAMDNVATQQSKLDERYEMLFEKYESGEITEERWLELSEKYEMLVEKLATRYERLNSLDMKIEEKLAEDGVMEQEREEVRNRVEEKLNDMLKQREEVKERVQERVDEVKQKVEERKGAGGNEIAPESGSDDSEDGNAGSNVRGR